jgi:hypothetical protein
MLSVASMSASLAPDEPHFQISAEVQISSLMIPKKLTIIVAYKTLLFYSFSSSTIVLEFKCGSNFISSADRIFL